MREALAPGVKEKKIQEKQNNVTSSSRAKGDTHDARVRARACVCVCARACDTERERENDLPRGTRKHI